MGADFFTFSTAHINNSTPCTFVATEQLPELGIGTAKARSWYLDVRVRYQLLWV